jgi:hypothetical protein
MKTEITSNIEVIKSKIKDGFWWLVSGAAISMIIGFTWGGWATAGTIQKMKNEAVLTSQTEICVAQFMNAPNGEANLKELEKVEGYNRSGLIEKGGWDKMPGQKEADRSVASACAAGLIDLMKK